MSMSDRISIILTERRRLSCVRLVLGGLLKNSHFKDHEIVFVGDRIHEECEGDFEVEGYNTVEQYLNDYWIAKMENAGFKFSLYKGNWSREKLDSLTWNKPVGLTPAYECWSYGVDRAKNNSVMCIGSDDYMSCDWDINIIKRFSQYDPRKYAFQPVFAFISRPRDDPTLQGQIPDDHPNKPGWKAFYIRYEDQQKKPLLESVVHDHWQNKKVDGVYLESGGTRNMISYWATVVHMDIIDKIREFNLNKQLYDWRRIRDGWEFNGREGECALDLDFDNKLNDVGAMKVGCLDSFIYNLKPFRESLKRGHHCFVFDMGEL